MDWQSGISGFISYVKVERAFSSHSIDAYRRDVEKLMQFSLLQDPPFRISHISSEDIESFLIYLHELGLSARSQARILSGITTFFNYCVLERIRDENPADVIEGPRQKRVIPDVLSYQEIIQILESIDLSTPHGHRNRAILELLYACGLRVSELIQVKFSSLYVSAGILRVIGKNNKERIVPIGKKALHYIDLYASHSRKQIKPKKGESDYIFLSNRGKRLSRQMIFLMIKKQCKIAGISKTVSPHTFRHSFASHLVEAGADLRAVQEMLGHESILTTEIYTHLQDDYLLQTVKDFHPRHANI